MSPIFPKAWAPKICYTWAKTNSPVLYQTSLLYLNPSPLLKLGLQDNLCVLHQDSSDHLEYTHLHFLPNKFLLCAIISPKFLFSHSAGLPLQKPLAKLTVNTSEEGKVALRMSGSYAAKGTHVNKPTMPQHTNGVKHAHHGSLGPLPAY